MDSSDCVYNSQRDRTPDWAMDIRMVSAAPATVGALWAVGHLGHGWSVAAVECGCDTDRSIRCSCWFTGMDGGGVGYSVHIGDSKA